VPVAVGAAVDRGNGDRQADESRYVRHMDLVEGHAVVVVVAVKAEDDADWRLATTRT
jgi:hypothetical protein